ncbi:hypothetical protein WN943_016254 [Citrus x changshan-huyou]
MHSRCEVRWLISDIQEVLSSSESSFQVKFGPRSCNEAAHHLAKLALCNPSRKFGDYNVALSTNERFYFCLRENDSREVSGLGWWRATGRVKKVYANYNNQTLVGFKRPLTFHRFSRDEPHDPRTKRNKAIKTNWIMHEYSLESYTTFVLYDATLCGQGTNGDRAMRDWRLCKIKYKGKPRVQEELENIIRSAAEEQQQ